jgi:hypothetical protein
MPEALGRHIEKLVRSRGGLVLKKIGLGPPPRYHPR